MARNQGKAKGTQGDIDATAKRAEDAKPAVRQVVVKYSDLNYIYQIEIISKC